MVGIVLVNTEVDHGPYLAIVLTVLAGNLCEVILEFTKREALLGYACSMMAIYGSSDKIQLEIIESDEE